jgi:lipopolysaccharide transport system permease protein
VSDSPKLTRHYTATARAPGWLVSVLPIVGFPAQIWEHRYLVQNFCRRELLGRFRGSLLGLFWVLVHPLFVFFVYYFVFGILFNPRTGGGPDPFFAIYLFSGVLGFTSINEGCMRSCTCVVDNGNLVKKVAFPSQLLPIPPIVVSLLVYLVGAVVCIVAGTVLGVLHPGPRLFLLPVVMLLQGAMTLGIGLFLANCYVFSRDTSHLWGIVSMAWMFLTPVFWLPQQLLTKVPFLATMFAFNPAYPLLQAQRLVLGVEDGPELGLGDLGSHLLAALAWALAFLGLGYGLFMSRRHKFADLV